jgi:hypothetical protein
VAASEDLSAARAEKKQAATQRRAPPANRAAAKPARAHTAKPARTQAAKPARSKAVHSTRATPKVDRGAAQSATRKVDRAATRKVDRAATRKVDRATTPKAGRDISRDATRPVDRATTRKVDRAVTREGTRQSGRSLTHGPARGVVATDKRITRGPGAVTTRRAIVRGPALERSRYVAHRRYWNGWRRPVRVVVIRDRWRFWGGYGWRTYVPFTALATFAVGAAVFYPAGYVSMAEPACVGVTPDGNRLRWMEVPTEEGGSEWQCVAYSPEPDRVVSELVLPDEPVAASPPVTGTLPPPVVTGSASAPAEQGERRGCELAIYSDANLRGTSALTDEDQTDLGPDGWKDEIASVEVKSGTWDFFTGDNYTGEMMRLGPGSYATLDAKWTRHIGSFMCSKPSGA